jgi:hypothetical protein
MSRVSLEEAHGLVLSSFDQVTTRATVENNRF